MIRGVGSEMAVRGPLAPADARPADATAQAPRAAHSIIGASVKHPAKQAGGRRRISRAGPVIRRQARRVRPGWAHRPRAPRMRPSVGPSGCLPHSSRPESAAGPPACRGGVAVLGSRPAAVWVQLRAGRSLSKRDAPARLAPADARPADATAQAPCPATHSPPLALLGSLRCPSGRAGAALADGHRPQDEIQRRMRSEAKIVLLTS